ncbi:uncharacterized protein E0L32_011048 [Thyridium curvatum]|uniref:Carrier domain-containing protein n=1 Tax=Thyridium curvatum TaxID=1093900 RepID=A0A507AS78_9PEZI|nr:uncharacterized protein E0L32_011048 [Thyridium curvatum]TPX07060.1 hypothetical protein E0L32_011048 [Thyridium curvatum]
MAVNSAAPLGDIGDDVLAKISEDCRISVHDIEDIYPCTPFQRGLLTDSELYIQRFVHSLDVTVDVDQFSAALRRVVSLNETLRTRIVDCDLGLVQVVVKDGLRTSDCVLRPSHLDLQQYLHHDRSAAMHLATPLARFAIVGRKLVTTIHHAISDHYSLKFLIADTWQIYKNRAPSRHAPFKMFAQYCSAIDRKRAAAFWKSQFRGGVPAIFPSIPPEHPAKASRKTVRNISLKSKVPPALMPAYIEAAWGMTAADYSGSDIVAFGYVMSGRSPALAGAETTLGPTITTVPMQVDLKPGMTIQQLLKSRTQSRRLLSTNPALQYGMARIRHNVSDEARIASSFQTVLNILHEAENEADTPGLALDEEMDIDRAYGLVLTCTLGDNGVLVKASFDSTVLPETQMQRVLRQMEHRLRALIDSPPNTAVRALQCLNFSDTLELMAWNRNFPETMDKCLHSTFSWQAGYAPDGMAVDAWDGRATYHELETMATNFVWELQQANDISPGEPILFSLERSLSAVVAVLGIMKAGGACVPIDVSLPQARKDSIAHIVGSRVVVTSSTKEKIAGCISHIIMLDPKTRPTSPESPELDPSRPAYIMFTSGSTGQPKGVVLEHRSLAASFSAFANRVGWTKGTRVLQFAAPAWDACALEMLGPLMVGGCVCIPSNEARESALGEYINSARVDFAIQTPTALRNLTPEGVLPSLKALMSAGEPIPPNASQYWGSKMRLFNGWGPCEASVCAAIAELTPASVFPDTIGTPVGGALWIVDPENPNKLLPIGAVGEILVEGPGVAREYLNEPSKTANSFITPPAFVPKRGSLPRKLYRTGDLAKYNHDGSIAFIGRQDNQVKIRGQRFELAEVEEVLARDPLVAAIALAVHRPSATDRKELIAVLNFSGDSGYSSPSEGADDGLREVFLDEGNVKQLQAICDFAKAKLPTYMVPTAWVVVAALPQTISAKIDRAKIRDWLTGLDISAARNRANGGQSGVSSLRLTPPTNRTEEALRHEWSAVLAVEKDKIGRESSFVKLGGDSIIAMQVASRCRKHGFRIHVATLLRTGTLAEAANETEALDDTSVIPTLRSAEEALDFCLSPIQKFLADNRGPASNNRFNQAFLLEINVDDTTADTSLHVEQALQKLVTQHSMLRARFSPSSDDKGNATFIQRILPAHGAQTWRFCVHSVDSEEHIQNIVNVTQASLDILKGPVFAADVILAPAGQTLLFMTAHHLVIDLVSWRILWEDLEAILRDHTHSLSPSLSFQLWVKQQQENTFKEFQTVSREQHTVWPKADLAFWGMHDRVSIMADMKHIRFALDREQTIRIMGEACNSPFNTTPPVLMLTAILQSWWRVFPERGAPALYSEAHGRDLSKGSAMDPSRTVGWFTTMMPLAVAGINASSTLKYAVMAVKDYYRDMSARATQEFTSQVLQSDSFRRSDVEMIFNFVGHLQQVTRRDALFKLLDRASIELKGAEDAEQVGLLSILAHIGEDGGLTFTLDYNGHMAHQDRIALWIRELEACLVTLAKELPLEGTRLTWSDLPLLKPGKTNLGQLHARLADIGVAPENVESIYHCTALQEGILFSQMKREWKGDEYRDRFAFRLATRSNTKVDTARVIDSWKALCKAHPVLRTIFTTGLSGDGAFQQIVLKHSEPSVSIEQMPVNCSDITEVFKNPKAAYYVQNQPPHRLSLYEGPGNVAYAILDISHTILDARTMRAIWENIGREYSYRKSIVKGRKFSDYVAWLQNQGDAVQQYWRTYVAGAQPCLLAPGAAVADSTYITRGPEIPFKDARSLTAFCQAQGITVANFMQAAWGVVLRLYTGLPSVYFGCLRSDEDGLDGLADILGPLVTMLVCKFNFEDPRTTSLGLLETAREDAARGLRNSGCSLAQLHDDIGLLTSPLFDTIMTIQHLWPADLSLGDGDLVVQPIEGEDPTEYSISVNVHYSKNELFLRLSYQRARISEQMAERIAETFATVIARILESPEQAPLESLEPIMAANKSTTSEHSAQIGTDLLLLKSWNSKTPAAVEECIPHRVRSVASRHPLAPAVCSWDRNLDYGQLDMLSDCLAYKILTEYGIGVEMIVPFACEKAASAIVCLLAISKCGAAFLPLDTTYTPDRLVTVLEDANASLVLVNSLSILAKMRACTSQAVVLVDLDDVIKESLARSASEIRSELVSVLVKPCDAAYAVYTSGSTGKPKGILVEHRSIATSAVGHAQRLGITERSRMLQLANFAFDLSLGDIMYALFSGACLCMPSEKERTDDIAGAINRTKANFLWATPTHATLLTPEDAPTLRTMSLIGEPMRQGNMETWASHVRLTNSYGPAEAAVMVSCRDVAIGDNSQDVGYPSCCRFWVVDPDNHDELVSIGTTGELIIEGPVVARGYINNPEATAAAFINPPAWTNSPEFTSLNLASQRFYKTGDLVTQMGEQSFICEGRKDTQIKIRGLRIELGEIEYHLNHHAEQGWNWVVEVIRPSCSEDACLAAFFQVEGLDSAGVAGSTDGGSGCGIGLLQPLPEKASAAKDMLSRTVPAYMVPDYFIHLQKLPTTSSMKTDRRSLRAIAAGLSKADLLAFRALEKPHSLEHHHAIEYRKEVADGEVFMQQAWAEVLGISAEVISADDDFFQVGGNSIRAMRLVARLRKAGRELSVVDVFDASRLADMTSKTISSPSAGHLPADDPVSMKKAPITAGSDAMPRLAEMGKKWTWLKSENIESVRPATDTQAWMLAVSNIEGHGFDDGVSLIPSPGHTLDLSKLQEACQQVLRQHAILRTVFVQHDSQLFQVILREPPVEQVHAWPNDRSKDREWSISGQSGLFKTLPHFHLSSDGGTSCHKLELRIHHALYDAISLRCLLQDLSAAYAGQALATRPTSFHEWVSHVTSEETANAKKFWKGLLRGSMSYSLSPHISSPVSGNPADSKLRISVPSKVLQVTNGTAAMILNAAWGFVLAHVLEQQDVIFGYISANRYSARLPGVEQVAGPCINILPVRVHLNGNLTAEGIVSELQRQSRDSMEHQHLGYRSIIRDCTQWPTSRFNSIIVFQNHESLGNLINVGGAECKFSGDGRVGDSADVWLTAMPQLDGQLNLDLHYSAANIAPEQAHWMLACLEAVLNAFSGSWTESLSQVTLHVLETRGSYPASPLVEGRTGNSMDDSTSVHGNIYKETKLSRSGGRQWDDRSGNMFENGQQCADLVNEMLLSGHYKYL